jgi:uncharacterized protein YbjT (DUF2867 family)
MYAITGITGKVGGAVARSLLAERLPVRAVLRDEAKAAECRTRGCEIALAELDDAASLSSAFRGADSAAYGAASALTNGGIRYSALRALERHVHGRHGISPSRTFETSCPARELSVCRGRPEVSGRLSRRGE